MRLTYFILLFSASLQSEKLMSQQEGSSSREMAIPTIATSKPPPKARPSMAATEGFLAAEKQSK